MKQLVFLSIPDVCIPFLLQPYESLNSYAWFHGKIDRPSIARLLKQDGDFIVREKSDGSGDHVLSVLWKGHAKHFILKPDDNVSVKVRVRNNEEKSL